MPQMPCIMPFAIRYGETDMMGVVHHANYVLYFEDARTRLLEELGYPYEQLEREGFMSPVFRSSCTMASPYATATNRSREPGSRR